MTFSWPLVKPLTTFEKHWKVYKMLYRWIESVWWQKQKTQKEVLQAPGYKVKDITEWDKDQTLKVLWLYIQKDTTAC